MENDKKDLNWKEKLKEEMKEIEEEAQSPTDFPLSGGTAPHIHDHSDEVKEEEKDKD